MNSYDPDLTPIGLTLLIRIAVTEARLCATLKQERHRTSGEHISGQVVIRSHDPVCCLEKAILQRLGGPGGIMVVVGLGRIYQVGEQVVFYTVRGTWLETVDMRPFAESCKLSALLLEVLEQDTSTRHPEQRSVFTYRSIWLIDVRVLDLGCSHEAFDWIFVLIARRVHCIVHQIINVGIMGSFEIAVIGRFARTVQEIVRVACRVWVNCEDVQELWDWSVTYSLQRRQPAYIFARKRIRFGIRRTLRSL